MTTSHSAQHFFPLYAPLNQRQENFSAAQTPSADYSCYEEIRRHSVDLGVTVEERRHRREYFILCPALGTMFDLFAAGLKSNSPRLHHQGSTAFPPQADQPQAEPSFRKGRASIAILLRINRASWNALTAPDKAHRQSHLSQLSKNSRVDEALGRDAGGKRPAFGDVLMNRLPDFASHFSAR